MAPVPANPLGAEELSIDLGSWKWFGVSAVVCTKISGYIGVTVERPFIAIGLISQRLAVCGAPVCSLHRLFIASVAVPVILLKAERFPHA